MKKKIELIRLTENDLNRMIKKAVNEVYYSSGDLGIEYDPSEDHINDYSIEDELSDEELEDIYANDYDAPHTNWWDEMEHMDKDGHYDYFDSFANDHMNDDGKYQMESIVRRVTNNVLKQLLK